MGRRHPTTTIPWYGRLAGLALALAACVSPSQDDGQAPQQVGAPQEGQAATTVEAPARATPTQVPTPNLPAPLEASIPADGPAAEMASDDLSSPVHGTITARYIGRESNDDDRDHDAYALVQASVNDSDSDPWDAYVSGRVARDLDGGIHDSASPYHSLADTHGDRTNTRLYEAWVDARASGLEMLRLGRQEMWDTPAWIRFDGLRVETLPEGGWRQQIGAYAGRPAPLESSGSGSSVWGAWLKDQPWSGGRTRLDIMNLKDDERLDGDQDTLLSADVRQQVGTELGLEGTYTWLEGSALDLDLRATWTRVEDGWTGQLAYHELLNEQHVSAEEFDPFSTALLTYEPYWQAGAMLAKSFADDVDVQGGWDTRRLDDSADEGEFNREFDRGFLTGVVHDVLVRGCSVSLTGERWSGDGSELDTWGVDVTQEWSGDVSASVGSYYSMYKDDLLLGQQDQDVRTWYAKLKLRSDPHLTWTFLFDHEVNEIATYDTLTVRAAWTF